MRTLVLGTAGHIDHGKSALVEALTGTHPDRLKEEQARGITIELGFAHARIGDLSVALVDVPGHERFVRTMLAGAGGLDAVLLIIAANESVMPQTREHFAICRLLGIERGLLVLTKRDLVEPDVLALAELDARDLVAGTALAGSPVIAVSAHTGEGLPELRHAIDALAQTVPARSKAGAARVPIDRAFSVKGFGTVVTGTLVSGGFAVDDTLTLLPVNRVARVRGLQVHGDAVASAAAPRRVAVNLGGVDLGDVRRGMTLAAADSLAVTRRVDVRVDLLPGSAPLRHGARVRVHQGTDDTVARVLVSAVRASAVAPWVPVSPGQMDVHAAPGGQAYARLRLGRSLVLTRGDRFVLRLPSPARTIGGGVVIDPEPLRGGVRRPGAAARFKTIDEGAPADIAVAWIDEAGLAGLTAADIARRGGVDVPHATALLHDQVRAARLVWCGARAVSEQRLTRAASDLLLLLAAYHRDHPAEAGLSREEARARVAKGAAPATFDVLISRAGARSVDQGERVALPDHRPAVTDAETQLRGAIARVLHEAGLQPPDVNGLAAALSAPVPAVQRALLVLAKERRVAKLADLWFHPDVLDDLKHRVRSMGVGTTVDVAAAKAMFNVSRKFAIPLLEYLDRERITRRTGDKRRVL